MKHNLTILFIFLFAPLAVLHAAGGPADIQPSNLRCEYLANPQGIDVLQPRLSWVLQPLDPAVRGLHQSASRHNWLAKRHNARRGRIHRFWKNNH